MKRILAFALAVCFAFMLTACGFKRAKKEIFNLVENNYDQILTACKNKDTQALLAIDGITKVSIVDGYVLVFCKGEGIAPSSQDYGFYYSEEDIPVGVGCALSIVASGDELSPEGDGYQCTIGGNTFYTQRIKGNIYFYSNAY